MAVTIRHSRPDDRDALFALYPLAFPEENLLPVLSDLLGATDVLSLVADKDGQVVGHIGFSPSSVSGSVAKLSLLAPLCVAPSLQKQGIGKQLIGAGLERLEADGVVRVLVLGDPNYYRRTGFAQDDAIAPPYPMPEDWKSAWQSQPLIEDAPSLKGRLQVPEFWQKPELWV